MTASNPNLRLVPHGDDSAPLLRPLGDWWAAHGLRDVLDALAALEPQHDLLLWLHLGLQAPLDEAVASALPIETTDPNAALNSALDALVDHLASHGWDDVDRDFAAALVRLAGNTLDASEQTGQDQAASPSSARPLARPASSRPGIRELSTVTLRRSPDDVPTAFPAVREPGSDYWRLTGAYDDDIVLAAEALANGQKPVLRLVGSDEQTVDVLFAGLRDLREDGVSITSRRAAASETEMSETVLPETSEDPITILFELPHELGTVVFAQKGGELLIRLAAPNAP